VCVARVFGLGIVFGCVWTIWLGCAFYDGVYFCVRFTSVLVGSYFCCFLLFIPLHCVFLHFYPYPLLPIHSPHTPATNCSLSALHLLLPTVAYAHYFLYSLVPTPTSTHTHYYPHALLPPLTTPSLDPLLLNSKYFPQPLLLISSTACSYFSLHLRPAPTTPSANYSLYQLLPTLYTFLTVPLNYESPASCSAL
jgi:hypothetical protein